MTIGHILNGLNTLEQYSILQRADVLFARRCGRYYGGVLTSDEIEVLYG